MSEQGGRYFREARFFLLGNKPVAQSHVLEARAMLGYLRDMHAMGGPPIHVKCATLEDGTQIKAVMMNGQYQAEINSPSVTAKTTCVRIPTIYGHRTYNFGSLSEYKIAFKWQKKTGIVYLPTPVGYLIGSGLDIPPTISTDGEIVSGEVLLPSGGFARHVIWYADGSYGVLPGADALTHYVDVRRGSVELIPVPVASAGNQLHWHRYIRVPEDDCTDPGQHLIFGRVFESGGSRGATVERNGATIAGDVLTVLDTLVTPPDSLVTGADMSGNLLTGWSEADANNDNISVKWTRLDRNSSYTKTALGNGLVSDVYVSDNGNTFAAYVVQHRLNSSSLPIKDSVPAVWTAAEGLVILVPFVFPLGDTTNTYQDDRLNGLSSDGLIAVGSRVINGSRDGGPLAWEKVEGVWQLMPELNLPFNGACVAVN